MVDSAWCCQVGACQTTLSDGVSNKWLKNILVLVGLHKLYDHSRQMFWHDLLKVGGCLTCSIVIDKLGRFVVLLLRVWQSPAIFDKIVFIHIANNIGAIADNHAPFVNPMIQNARRYFHFCFGHSMHLCWFIGRQINFQVTRSIG